MSSERSAIITAQCREAFDNLIAYMRIIKRRAFLTPPLLDSDYVSLELTPPDTLPAKESLAFWLRSLRIAQTPKLSGYAG
ncbi:MAG: hypothetical protein LBH43_07545, partial [Treponema sp.]|nr:hypothetical protein [Treponema sp.]